MHSEITWRIGALLVGMALGVMLVLACLSWFDVTPRNETGRYQVATGGDGRWVWRLDTATGEIVVLDRYGKPIRKR